MLFNTVTFVGLLTGTLLLSGCDKDPLSQKGKIFLPDNAAEQQSDMLVKAPQMISNVPQNSGDIFQYLPAASKPKQSPQNSSEVMSIDWDALIPDSHRPDPDLIDQYNNGEIEATDPRIIALKELMRELLELAPVNQDLAGKVVKLPGFVIPIEHDGDRVSGFLLVPYHGACIHVPAPPSNQIIYVRVPGGTDAAKRVYDTVSVTGKLSIERVENDVAESGYIIDAIAVEPFE